MISGTIRCPSQEPVPHRWHVLEILRAMHAGHPFIRLAASACSTHLEGVPLAVHFFEFLHRNGYIAPVARKGLLAHYYALTPEGETLYEEGERWWRSLDWWEKLCVRVRG